MSKWRELLEQIIDAWSTDTIDAIMFSKLRAEVERIEASHIVDHGEDHACAHCVAIGRREAEAALAEHHKRFLYEKEMACPVCGLVR